MDKGSEILNRRDTEIVPLRKSHFKEAIKTISEEDGSLRKINDKILLAIARRTGIQIYTYDRRLKGQAERKMLNF